jgi:hypothetical protein
MTFLVPSSTSEPMVIDLQDQPLRMVVVDKEAVGRLDKEWDAPGLYFLFGEHSEGLPRYTAYAGKSPAGLRGRIVSHARSREEPWSRALLMTSSAGLDSSAIGWLEGRLYGVLTDAIHCDVTNRTRPGDNTVPDYRQAVLEQYIPLITAAMRALGYSPDSAHQHPGQAEPEAGAEASEIFVRFWSGMLEQTAARELIGARVGPRKNHWMGTVIAPGLEYNFVVTKHKSRVELIFRKDRRSEYESLQDQDVEWPDELVWDPGRNAEGQCRVLIPVAGGILDENGWTDLQARLVDTMRRLRSIMDSSVLPEN